MDVIDLNHFILQTHDGNDNRHQIRLRFVRVGEMFDVVDLEAIAQFQIAMIRSFDLGRHPIFILLRHLLHRQDRWGFGKRNGIERYTVQGQLIVHGGEFQLEVTLRRSGPLVKPITSTLQRKGTAGAVQIDFL